MPLKYRVEAEGGEYKIFEIETEQFVFTYKDKNEAHRKAKKLNRSDACFNGWTPSFMIREIDWDKVTKQKYGNKRSK